MPTPSSSSTSSSRNANSLSPKTFETEIEGALKDNSSLLSWKSAFIRLSSPSRSSLAIKSLRNWLLASPQLSSLSLCYNAFPPQNEASKRSFETKTAAINITSDSLIPVAEIKEDAKTLSDQLGIDEIEALRICVLDFQDRLSVASSTADESELSSGYGPIDIRLKGSLWQSGPDSGAPPTASSESDSKLHRHVQRYFSERRYLLKTAAALVRASIHRPSGNGSKNYFHGVGRRIVRKLVSSTNTQGAKSRSFLECLIAGLESRAVGGDRPKYVNDRLYLEGGDKILYEWEKHTLLEEVHLLQLIFLLIYKPVRATGPIVSSWFLTMKKTNFLLDQLSLSKQQATSLQSISAAICPLASVVSVAMLSLDKLPTRVSDINGNDISTGSTQEPLYLESVSAVKVLHSILLEFVTERNESAASLAGWGWAITLRNLRDLVGICKGYLEDHERDSSDSSSSEQQMIQIASKYDMVISDLDSLENGNGYHNDVVALANGAVQCNLFDAISALFLGVGGDSGWSLAREEDSGLMQKVLTTLLRTGMEWTQFNEKILQTVIIAHGTQFPKALKSPDVDEFNDSELEELDSDEEPSPRNSNSDNMSVGPVSRQYNDTHESNDIVEAFWNDMTTLQRTIYPACWRFPYESLPFLALIRSVTPADHLNSRDNPSHKYLADLRSYTQVLPTHFRGSEVDTVDPENIILTEPLTVLHGRAEDGEGAIILPEGLMGRVVSSGVSPPIVKWDFKYSAVQYMGRILENALVDEFSVDQGIMIEILGIFERILNSYKISTGIEDDNEDEEMEGGATAILEQASDLMAENNDIVSVIFDLNESALSSCLEEKSTELAVASLRLVTTLLPIIPGRVWPYLGRSTLLERHGRGGSMSRILESVEVVNGSYNLLLECLRVYEAIVADALQGVVVSGTIGSAASVVGGEGVGSGVSRAVQMDILENWTRFWGGIVGGFRGWKYVDVGQRTSLNYQIFSVFGTILSTVYGLDTNLKDSQGVSLFTVLKPSAEYLVHLFLTDEEAVLPLEPLISALSDGCATPETTMYVGAQRAWVSSVIGTLTFATTAVRIRALLGLPPSQLETLLYTKAPSLATMYELDFRYRLPVIELLESLVNNSHTWPKEPPSLLGHLGQIGATKFVALLTHLDGKIRDEELECAIWRFVSAVLGNKQQGLSIMLVAGANQSKKQKDKSMLRIALDALSDISDLPSAITLAMLETVSLAQNFWGSVTAEIRNHKHFLDAISTFVAGMNVEFLPADENPIITEKCNRLATAAYIAQLLAMHLHQDKGNIRGPAAIGESGSSFLNNIIPKLGFYTERAVTISSYKPSLHGFLTTNFEKKWPSCKLESLKKSQIQRREYGPHYFYDVRIAGTVLGWDKGWDKVKTEKVNGHSSRTISKRWGFKHDVERANLNIALVDSQVALLRAWSLLSAELASHINSQSQAISTILGKVVKASLKANISDSLPGHISTVVTADRAGLAFTLLSKLRDHTPALPITTFDGMLDIAWQVIVYSEEDFRRSFRHGGDDYYRSLLRILYILLNVEVSKSEIPSPSLLQKLAEIFELVVAKGFSDLASAAYEYRELSEPADMLLVIGILQLILSFKSIDPIYNSLIGHLEDNGTLRAASTLFTWAPKLSVASHGNNDADPVYGELSIMFLVKLSALPVIAEQLILGNVFIALTEGELSTKIQAGNLSPISTPRLHNIWAKGFLPLVLNLLYTLGNRIANEVSAFLRSFTRQFSTAVQMLDKPTAISIPQISEMTDIIAIITLLDEMGILILPDFKEKRRMVASACSQWTTHKAWLSSLVVPTSAAEDLLWENGKDGNKLIEKVLEESRALNLLASLDDEEEDDDMGK